MSVTKAGNAANATVQVTTSSEARRTKNARREINGALSLTSSLGYFGASRISATAGTSETSTITFCTAGGNTALAAGTTQGPGTLNVQTNTGGAVQFFNTPLTNGLIGGGFTFGSTSLEWATLSGYNVIALSSYQTNTNPNTWVATDNVKVSVAPTVNLTASRTINSLNMASESTLTLNAGTTLTIGWHWPGSLSGPVFAVVTERCGTRKRNSALSVPTERVGFLPTTLGH